MRKLSYRIEFKIAADGSSASGKTTGGKLIAKKLDMKFLSSGTLYRFCALKTLENENKYNIKFINKVANSITLKKLQNKELYSPEVARLSSIIAKKSYVRKALKSFQKNFIKKSINILCRGAALRYLLTRLYDYSNTPKTALIKIKDPNEYYQKLLSHNNLNSFKDYLN